MSLRCLNELGIGGTIHISRQHVLVFLDPTHTTYLSADVSVFHVQFEYDIRYFENPPTYFFYRKLVSRSLTYLVSLVP